jgi:hypothetical protein
MVCIFTTANAKGKPYLNRWGCFATKARAKVALREEIRLLPSWKKLGQGRNAHIGAPDVIQDLFGMAVVVRHTGALGRALRRTR